MSMAAQWTVQADFKSRVATLRNLPRGVSRCEEQLGAVPRIFVYLCVERKEQKDGGLDGDSSKTSILPLPVPIDTAELVHVCRRKTEWSYNGP